MCNNRKYKSIWNKPDHISKYVGNYRQHAKLFSVYPESADLQKRDQIISIRPFFCCYSSVFLEKEQKIYKQQHIQKKKHDTNMLYFTFCTVFQCFSLPGIRSEYLIFFNSLLPLTIIKTPAVIPVTSVTIPRAMLPCSCSAHRFIYFFVHGKASSYN